MGTDTTMTSPFTRVAAQWLRVIAVPLALLSLLALAGCPGSIATGPRLIGEGRRALFVGNSYLYTMDIPGIVQASAALRIVVGLLAVAGPARRAIRINPTEALRVS